MEACLENNQADKIILPKPASKEYYHESYCKILEMLKQTQNSNISIHGPQHTSAFKIVPKGDDFHISRNANYGGIIDNNTVNF